ncbi:MAG TPA: pitrilysin family protein [candidate division Zixibacteria bacterium]|nr:pitrilysin family protein [candidate division Zixibacteria bacterium]
MKIESRKRPAVYWSLIAALLSVLTVAAGAVAFDISEYEKRIVHHTLDNGLTLIILERHDAPVASLVTYANVGSVDDPKGFTGMAHVFEHMAFKGDNEIGTNNFADEVKAIQAEEDAFLAWRAERVKGALADSAKVSALEQAFRDAQSACDQYVITNELPNIVEREGFVDLNAFTSMDQTCYLYNFPENKLELALMLEARRFSNTVLREYHKEVDVVKEERRMRSESNPIGKLVEEFLAAAFKAHPYGVPGVGHMSDLGNYSREEAMEFFRKYYVPNNLCVAVVGDVDANEVIKFAEKYFGDLPRGEDVMLIQTVEPPQSGERRVVVEDPSQVVWVAGYHVPEGAHPDRPALDALVDYLGSGRTSLLYKKLVKDEKKAIDVGAFTGFPGDKYPSLVAVYGFAAKDITPQDLETLILAEVERVKEEPLPADEVEKIRARAKSSFINQLNSRQGLAIQLAQYQMIEGDWRHLFQQLDKINAVTAEDIQRVAREYLTSANRTVGYIQTTGS